MYFCKQNKNNIMRKYKKIEKQVEQRFVWYPVTEKPKELDCPVIFLTDKGAIVAHSKLLSSQRVVNSNGETETISLFNRYSAYSNAIAWIYQKELIPDSLEYVESSTPKKKRTIKRAKCIVGYDGFFEEGKLYRYTIQKTNGRITVSNEKGMKIEYPSKELMKRNFEITTI